jgi:hypothetical protein
MDMPMREWQKREEFVNIEKPEDLSPETMAGLVLDMLHRSMVHYTLWFTEAVHQFGMERALELMQAARQKSYRVQMERFAKVLGFELKDGIPKVLLDMPREALLELMNHIGANWLANDGIWFQAIEEARDMYDAKRCNDSCWTRFSPFEAWSIREFLGLPRQAGLDGLKKALRFRIYARINVQSIIDEAPHSFVFQMNDCRVQSARKRKGLADYPCKSAGLVEYRSFGEAIDPRIRCECISCPPDHHPEKWFCAWRFSFPEGI